MPGILGDLVNEIPYGEMRRLEQFTELLGGSIDADVT
jgi:hypothetical protein